MGPTACKDFFQGLATGDDAKVIELLNAVLFFRCGPNPGASCDGYFNQDADAIDEDNARLGSIPVRTDIDPAEHGEAFDVLQSRTLRDLATHPYWHSGHNPELWLPTRMS